MCINQQLHMYLNHLGNIAMKEINYKLCLQANWKKGIHKYFYKVMSDFVHVYWPNQQWNERIHILHAFLGKVLNFLKELACKNYGEHLLDIFKWQ